MMIIRIFGSKKFNSVLLIVVVFIGTKGQITLDYKIDLFIRLNQKIEIGKTKYRDGKLLSLIVPVFIRSFEFDSFSFASPFFCRFRKRKTRDIPQNKTAKPPPTTTPISNGTAKKNIARCCKPIAKVL